MLLALTAIPAGLAAASEVRYAMGKRAATRAFHETKVAKPPDVGTTRSLRILPLVDWFTSGNGLEGEPGVSYLIQTDTNSILLDVGLNFGRAEPSALLHNMQELGVRLAEIDTIVISHLHADHVGGIPWLRRRTFSLGNEQLDLRGKRVFVPEPMSYPGIETVCTATPTAIAPGVATIGAIRSQIYMGRIDEQALAIRLEGRGLVLVVGCGHQSLRRILTRAKELFDDPIYGIIGGLHYPVPRGRWFTMGLDLQKLLVYGPLDAPRLEDAMRDVELLAEHRPGWVSLSAHDSSDEMIERFHDVFGPRYHYLRVGEAQVVGEASGCAPALSA